MRGLYKNYLIDRSYKNNRNAKKVEIALKYELKSCVVEPMDKLMIICKMQPDGIIVKYFTSILINQEEKANLDLSQLKTETGQPLVRRKYLETDWENILRMC